MPVEIPKNTQNSPKIYQTWTKHRVPERSGGPCSFLFRSFRKKVSKNYWFPFTARVLDRFLTKFNKIWALRVTPKNSPERVRSSILGSKGGSRTIFSRISLKIIKNVLFLHFFVEKVMQKLTEIDTGLFWKIRVKTCWQRSADVQNLS